MVLDLRKRLFVSKRKMAFSYFTLQANGMNSSPYFSMA